MVRSGKGGGCPSRARKDKEILPKNDPLRRHSATLGSKDSRTYSTSTIHQP
jgi:hypothetical protein